MVQTLEEIVHIGRLFDFYGGLLTERQRLFLQLYYFEDLSLAEIADDAGVSRQAVHDVIRRAETALKNYESGLGLVARSLVREHQLREVAAGLSRVCHRLEKKGIGESADLDRLRVLLERVIEEER